MSDTPQPQADAPTAATPAVAAPPPQAQPQAPPPAPAAQQQSNAPLELDPNMQIALPKKEGGEELVQLQQLVDRWSSSPAMDQGAMEQFQLFQQAAAGDADASRKLIDLAMPPKEPAPVVSSDPMVAEMQETIKALQAQVGDLAPTVDKVRAAGGQTVLKQIIESQKEHFPMVAAHPQGMQRAWDNYQQAKEMARSNGFNLDDQQIHMKVIGTAIHHANNQMMAEYQAYKGMSFPEAQAPVAQPVQAMDDQGKTAGPLPQPPPGTTWLNGKLVDHYGRSVPIPEGMQIPSSGPLPGANVDPAGASTTVTPESQPVRGPFNQETLRRMIRGRMGAQQT